MILEWTQGSVVVEEEGQAVRSDEIAQPGAEVLVAWRDTLFIAHYHPVFESLV